jgi:4-oxalocrotonate tautomerase
MPHVIVKPWPGKSEQQKRRLAQAITDDVMKVLQYGDESVSVAFEEVDANDWGQKVYEPDIARKADTLYKKPGGDRRSSHLAERYRTKLRDSPRLRGRAMLAGCPGRCGRSRLGCDKDRWSRCAGRFRDGIPHADLAAFSDDPAAAVSGRYWHHRQPQRAAREASDTRYQDQLSSRLAELTGVPLF